MNVGDSVVALSFIDANGEKKSLADFLGKKLVLYFYPKDNTSGCTKQACDFNENLKAFEKLKCNVVGVSKDSYKSHDNFSKKFDLRFPLISDDGSFSQAFGVWVEKSMYGRKYFGIERSTFLIDEKGFVEKIWRKVKVPGHVDEVKESL